MQLSENRRSLRNTLDTWYAVTFNGTDDDRDYTYAVEHDVKFYAKGADKCALLAPILRPAAVINLDDLDCPPFRYLSNDRPSKYNKPAAYAKWLTEVYLSKDPTICPSCMMALPTRKTQLTKHECECGNDYWRDSQGDECCGDCGVKLHAKPTGPGAETTDGPVSTT
ncbi:uncharacterized protein LOC129600789 [Paramacrobiotus metropolitanus]|uniref:uncharacterized protein LOC129600789 n=1 Tax=Paramacrobiotus metropolitanus TaxID=2943436 RepID=UPI00244570EA|nr:uncharacterized protein LOC129600789 [Paramacrobiotus metropolitanus]